MPLEVYLTAHALADVEHSRRWWSDHRSKEQAERWHRACDAALDSLGMRAEKCPLARESRHAPVELRQLAFGVGRRRTHRLVFAIRPDRIVVYRVQHLAQDTMSTDDL
jgi:plasmid stabilization system protein ParE